MTPVGRLAREDKGNGTFTTYQYDLAGNLLGLVNHRDAATVNSSYAYTYDGTGHNDTVTDPVAPLAGLADRY